MKITKAIERAATVVIVGNVGVVAAGYAVHGHERVFEAVHGAVVVFFLAELCVRLRTGRWSFLRRPVNLFDALVILLSTLPMLGVDASLLRLARTARLIHLSRHLPLLRLVRLIRQPAAQSA